MKWIITWIAAGIASMILGYGGSHPYVVLVGYTCFVFAVCATAIYVERVKEARERVARREQLYRNG